MVHLSYNSNKVDKDTVCNLYAIANFHFMFLDNTFLTILKFFSNICNLFLREWARFFPAEEIDHSRSFFDISPSLIRQIHFDQDIARPHPLLANLLFPSFDLSDIFGRDQHFLDIVCYTFCLSMLFKSFLNLPLFARHHLDHIPLLHSLLPNQKSTERSCF